MNIRSYSENDYPGLKACMEANGSFDDVSDAPENFAASVNREPHAVFVAEHEGQIIGGIAATPIGINMALIYRLVARDDPLQETAIARLLEHVERHLAIAGRKEVWAFIGRAATGMDAFMTEHGYCMDNVEESPYDAYCKQIER